MVIVALPVVASTVVLASPSCTVTVLRRTAQACLAGNLTTAVLPTGPLAGEIDTGEMGGSATAAPGSGATITAPPSANPNAASETHILRRPRIVISSPVEASASSGEAV